MKIKEIISKSEKELRDLLLEKKDELLKLNLDNHQNKLKNTRSLFNTRKEIARILTLIRERELSAQEIQSETQKKEKTVKAVK